MKQVFTPELRRAMHRQNRQRPKELTPVPRDQWPNEGPNSNRIEVWLSRKILVQVFDEGDGITRLSINRTVLRPDGEWAEGLTWDELQAIKRQVGRGDQWAVEMKAQFDGTQGNGYQPLSTYGRLRDSLQNHFGMIEEAGRSMRKYSVYFPALNPDILDELKQVKRRVDQLIAAFETLEQDEGE